MVPVSRSHHPVVQAGSAATALQLDHSLQQDQQLHNLHQPAQLGDHCYCELYLYVWECNTTIWARNVFGKRFISCKNGMFYNKVNYVTG